MAVEVIWSDIEHHRDVRTESNNRFELKAAGFDHREAGITRHIDARDQRRAGVPGNLAGAPGRFQDVADERRRRGAAVPTCDAHQAAPPESPLQFQLTPNRYPDDT